MAEFEHHRLKVDRQLGALRLQVDLRLSAPWTLLFGPSGSGKSSLLRAACGLLGQRAVQFSRRVEPGYDVPLLSRVRNTPPHLLGLAYAPQQGALFPHLSVEQNVAFALQQRSLRGTALNSITDLLRMFEIEPLRTRMPTMLSGGERQRVNLARAFAVPSPHLLLLDEPFTGMGRELRDRLLERMLVWTQERGLPVLSVSHDVDEALLAKAEVYVLEDGAVVRHGPAAQALAEERDRLLTALG